MNPDIGLKIKYVDVKEPGDLLSLVEYRFAANHVSGATTFADERIYRVRFPRKLQRQGESILNAWLPVALSKVAAAVESIENPGTGPDVLIVIEPQDMLNWHVRQCGHQRAGATGLYCGARGMVDVGNGKTTFAICQKCDVPDDRIRCSHLVHYSVSEIKAGVRAINGAMCEFGRHEVQVRSRLCQAGGHECWEKVVRVPSPLESLEEGLEDRVCDEIDHWNLAVRHLHGKRILQPTQLRTVKELVTPCKSERDFKSKVQVVADLLAKIDVSSLLEGTPPEKGALNELEAFYVQAKYNTGDSIKIFRAITQLRQDFPAHSGNERVIAACARLGIPYAPSDWDATWRLVLRAFTGAVRTLRTALPE